MPTQRFPLVLLASRHSLLAVGGFCSDAFRRKAQRGHAHVLVCCIVFARSRSHSLAGFGMRRRAFFPYYLSFGWDHVDHVLLINDSLRSRSTKHNFLPRVHEMLFIFDEMNRRVDRKMIRSETRCQHHLKHSFSSVLRRVLECSLFSKKFSQKGPIWTQVPKPSET